MEMVSFGENNITYWGLSLREAQSLAGLSLSLWGWVGVSLPCIPKASRSRPRQDALD